MTNLNQKNSMVKVQVKRISDNGRTSLGVLYIDGIAKCGTIEDREQKGSKVKGITRVSNGTYKLGLRSEGSFHSKYLSKYGKDYHKGMLCIYNAPNWSLKCPDGKEFQYILIHLGNTDKDTEGCLLPNFVLDFANDKGSRSGDAYEHIYPILRDAILSNPNGYIGIEYSDIEEGK